MLCIVRLDGRYFVCIKLTDCESGPDAMVQSATDARTSYTSFRQHDHNLAS